jgi:hypothetical protein
VILDSSFSKMSLSLNYVPSFDGSNYGYWKSCTRLFLKLIDVWSIIESEWTTPNTVIAEWTVLQKQTRVANDRAMNVIYLALSLAEFSRISHYETAQEAWNCPGSMGDLKNYIW